MVGAWVNLVQTVEQMTDREPWALKEGSSLVANVGCHAIFFLDRLIITLRGVP